MPRYRNQQLLDQIGARIQRLRIDRGLTQEALAELVDVQPESLSRAESGTRSLSISNLARVAEALHVGLGDLLDVQRPVPTPERSPEEEELLRLWNGFDAAQQEGLLRIVREVAGLLYLERRAQP